MARERILPLFFFLAVLFCLLGCPLYASAQNTAAQPATNSPDVAGSKGSLSTYSNSSSLQTLGIDTTQPQRTDDQGNSVDKNENPFGTSNKILVNNMSIATAGIGDDKRFNIKDVKDRKIIYGSAVMTDNSSDDWAVLPKVMTSANIKGTSGYQQVLTAVLVPKSGSTYDLKLVIEDYNGGGKANTPTRYILTLAQGLTMPDAYMNFTGLIPEAKLDTNQSVLGKASYSFTSGTRPSEIYKSHFRIVACAGRVAILVDRTLYDYKLTCSKSGYSAALLRSTTFNGSSSLAPIAAGDTPLIDLKAGDPNGDGLQELVMTVSSAEGTNPGHLLIYKWEKNDDSSFGQPVYNFNPSKEYVNGSESNISVTVGNITGSGDAVLMGNYFKNESQWYWSYVTYDHNKGQFVFNRGNRHEGITKSNDTNVKAKALPAMTCVSFSAPQAGAAQYVFYDGFVLQYNSGTTNLDVVYSPPFLEEWIKKPKTEILFSSTSDIHRGVEAIYSDTAVGNLFNSSSDKPLPQQLTVMLQDTVFGTYGAMFYFVDKGQITSALDSSVSRSDRHLVPTDIFVRPALTGAVVKGKYSSLQFAGASFAMSDPKVVAILGASPYYKEFENDYGHGWGNEATTYGTSETSGTENSQGFTLTAGAAIGTDVEISTGFIVSEKIAEFEAEVSVTDEFTREWSKAKSVTIGRNFSAVADDMVVISSIPYDIYKFRICDPGNKDRDGKLTTLYVPYEPRLSLMNLADYNDAVAQINQGKNGAIADVVPNTVLGQHMIGDPRTYPSGMDSNKFQNINQKSVITGGEFLGVGTGNGLSEQSISTGIESSSSFNNAINLDVSFKATVGSLVLGASRGVGYNTGVTISNGSSTELSGSVVNLPSWKQNYDFTWKLVGYQVNLPSGSCCPVVNYLVKTAHVPPPVPENLQLLSYGGTSAAIGWDAVQDSNLSQYLIYRSTSKDIDTTKDLYDTLTIFPKWVIGQKPAQVKYQDTKLEQGKQYYYEIVAEASCQGALLDSQPSEALAVPALVTGLTIKSQPQLQYNEGDTLNLSGLVLTAALSDGKTKDLTLQDLKKRGVTFSIPNGTILSLDDSGVPLYITDPMTKLLVVTNPLTVTKNSTNSSVSSISFTVGSTDNAAWLAAGQKLTAHIGITNKQSAPQSVIAIVALFDPNGTMYSVNYSSQTIAAGASKTIDVGGFTLPSPINGYTAKAFLVEGTQFDTSSLRPMSSIGQIGAQSSGSGGSDAAAKNQTIGNVTYVINP